jgi:hypothetical protein
MGGFSGDSMGWASSMVSLMGSAAERVQANQRQKAMDDTQQQAFDQQAAALRRQQDAETRDREDLLRRTLAAQRARLGAMGVGSSGGSATALVEGLTQRAATDVANIGQRYGDSLAALELRRQRQSASSGQSLPLLPDLFSNGAGN